MFGDSSQHVVSAVAFLRVKFNPENYCSTEMGLVFGNAQVSPMKTLTITKLEL